MSNSKKISETYKYRYCWLQDILKKRDFDKNLRYLIVCFKKFYIPLTEYGPNIILR